MTNNNLVFDEVIGLLLEVKMGLQKVKSAFCSQLIDKVDTCITRLAPLHDVWSSSANSCPVRGSHNNLDRSINMERSLIEDYRPAKDPFSALEPASPMGS